MISLEGAIYYLVLLDSVIANILIWGFAKWYKKRYRTFHKLFPASKGWAILYLVLVLWLGLALNRLGIV